MPTINLPDDELAAVTAAMAGRGLTACRQLTLPPTSSLR